MLQSLWLPAAQTPLLHYLTTLNVYYTNKMTNIHKYIKSNQSVEVQQQMKWKCQQSRHVDKPHQILMLFIRSFLRDQKQWHSKNVELFKISF